MLMHRVNVCLRGPSSYWCVSYFFPTPFEKKFFPFEIIPFLCLALSEVHRELERFRESDAYEKWKEEEEGKLQYYYCTFMTN